MILSYHAVPTEEEMFFISRPLRVPFRKVVIQFSSFFGVFDILCGISWD